MKMFVHWNDPDKEKSMIDHDHHYDDQGNMSSRWFGNPDNDLTIMIMI